MNEHAGDALTALIDGTLEATSAAEVEAHLRACPACRAEAAALRATKADLQALPRPALTETDRARLHAGLRKARTGRGGPWVKIAAVAASIVLIAGGATMLSRTGDGDGGFAALSGGAPAVVQDLDYSEDTARALLTDATTAKGPAAAEHADTAETTNAPAALGSGQTGSRASDDLAIPAIDHQARIAECEATFLGSNDVERIHRIVARYQGEPAYLLAYRVPASEPVRLELWILAIEDCGVRYFAEEDL